MKEKETEADDIGNCKLNLNENSMINVSDFVWIRDTLENTVEVRPSAVKSTKFDEAGTLKGVRR